MCYLAPGGVERPYINMLATSCACASHCGFGTFDRAATRTLISRDRHKLFSASKSHFQTITAQARSHYVQSPVEWPAAILGEGAERAPRPHTPAPLNNADKDGRRRAKG